jgi:hypothetical protein
MRTLNTYVHAVGQVDGQAMSQTFGPGEKVPEWARKAITNPKVWDGEDDVPAEEAPAVLERPAGNASREKWAAYAVQEGVELEPDMQRDDIKAAVDLAKE